MFPALNILIKGIVLGITVSIPFGPIGILLVNRTLKRGMLSGFFSGMGVATADTIIAIIAGLGFTFIISFLQEEKLLTSLLAGITIAGIGIKILLSNPIKEFKKNGNDNKSHLRDYFSILALSLSSPYTIFVFVAFFSGININSVVKPQLVPLLFIPGVFLGTLSWWFCLSYFVSRFKKSIKLRGIIRVNQIAGLIITIIGAIVLIATFTTLIR